MVGFYWQVLGPWWGFGWEGSSMGQGIGMIGSLRTMLSWGRKCPDFRLYYYVWVVGVKGFSIKVLCNHWALDTDVEKQVKGEFSGIMKHLGL